MELLKCNTAFLPDPRSSGQGAGKQDQAAAIANVQKRKQEALEKQLDAGDDSGKTREHLEPKKRVGDGPLTAAAAVAATSSAKLW